MNKSDNLSKDAYSDIRKMIFLGKFSPGQSIAYRKMASELNMSLTPVVQALKVMEHQTFVRHEKNRGFFVEKITPQEVKEAYRFREIIEVDLVPDIIENLDSKNKTVLRQALNEFLETDKGNSEKAKLAKDINFHMTIATLSGQKIAVWILRYLYDLLYLRFDKGLIRYHSNDKSPEEHQAIFDSLLRHDIPAAQGAIRKHIRNICANTLNSMDSLASDLKEVEI